MQYILVSIWKTLISYNLRCKLIKNLSLLGLCENSLNWFKSYLHQRKQKTKANNNLSTEKMITYGVPQGSVLGVGCVVWHAYQL